MSTTVNQPTIDRKVLDRVKKLLALANDAGATEAEAALAAERARQIMADNGISNATIEASGGQGEGRSADKRKGHTGKHWMREIMRALAKQSFVTVDWTPGSARTVWSEEEQDYVKAGNKAGHWDLWGRESAVVTVKLMHEYLVRTVDRVARERNTPTDEVFKEAMGMRIAERLEERHERAMAEQAHSEEAKAKRAKAEARSEKEQAEWEERRRKRYQKWADRQNSPSYRAGRSAAEKVGLDGQVGQSTAKKLS